jgi:hypothetical protein
MVTRHALDVEFLVRIQAPQHFIRYELLIIFRKKMKFSRRRLRPRLPETGPQKFSAAFSLARPKGGRAKTLGKNF